MTDGAVAGSFRDPSGFLFFQNGVLYRQVNHCYRGDYETLMASGLYDKLAGPGRMVSHAEAPLSLRRTDDAYKVISPTRIPFISYPYEWCFSQLKDAALLTLKIQKLALEYGMSLKDASNYNVQFHQGRPVFIDTLSFEHYREGHPWVAYGQFCEHFLAPLLLMRYVSPDSNRLLRNYIGGVPLEFVSRVLPWKTRLSPSLLTHIHAHARSKRHFGGKPLKSTRMKFSRTAFLGILDSLESTIKGLAWTPAGTEWGEYYEDTNYTAEAHETKKRLVAEFIDRIHPETLWDLGANDGTFSRIASDRGIRTISFDYDPASVEKNYLTVRTNKEDKLLPLIMDLTNPSPDLGWDNEERASLTSRGPCHTVMALALIHHLAISNNVPLPRIAAYLRKLCRFLIIEWVPKEDSQVQRLLSTREDIFPNYTAPYFQEAFRKYFRILESMPIEGSIRTLFLMEVRSGLHTT